MVDNKTICIQIQFKSPSHLFPHRCICPEGTYGLRCKIFERQFHGGTPTGSWVWLPPINPCSKLGISVNFRTDTQNCTIVSTHRHQGERSVGVTLKLQEGTPEFLLDLKDTSVSVRIERVLSDLQWHQLDITWRNKVRFEKNTV